MADEEGSYARSVSGYLRKKAGKDSASVNAALAVLREECGEEHFSQIFKTITADQILRFADLLLQFTNR